MLLTLGVDDDDDDVAEMAAFEGRKKLGYRNAGRDKKREAQKQQQAPR